MYNINSMLINLFSPTTEELLDTLKNKSYSTVSQCTKIATRIGTAKYTPREIFDYIRSKCKFHAIIIVYVSI